MILEGVKLALIGMSTVFAFLVLLLLLIQLSTHLLRAITEKETLAEALHGVGAHGDDRLHGAHAVPVPSDVEERTQHAGVDQ